MKFQLPLSLLVGVQLLKVSAAFVPDCTQYKYRIADEHVHPPKQQQTPGSRRSSSSFTKLWVASSLIPDGVSQDAAATSGGSSYIRWNTQSSCSEDAWEFQTAVTTFQRVNPETKQPERIELHAQVHYGSEDYFNFYNTLAFQEAHDEVLYELLVDEGLLGLSKDGSGRVLTETLQASPNDQSLARDYGWQCQVDVMDYTQANWKHADFTRQELLREQQQQLQKDATKVDSGLPMWQQVSNNAGTAFWQPAVSALLVGPPSLYVAADTKDASFAAKRRLFTNLFLPGNRIAGWLRAMLWMTVPAPEMSVLLLDWSSLFLSKSSAAKFSPVTLPILQSLMTLQILSLRQLVFGQVLVAGNSAQQRQTQQQPQNQDWTLLVTQRNDHALQVLQSSLRRNREPKRLALLYGCSHCPDLHTKLVQDFGFSATKTEWRTAWSVSVATTFAKEKKNLQGSPDADEKLGQSKPDRSLQEEVYLSLPPTAWAALVVMFPLYLGVGAVDWVDTIHSSSVSLFENHDTVSFGGEWLFYLLRHVLLYVGVSKLTLEWKDGNR